MITRIYENLSPWLRRPSPLICRSNPPAGRRCDTGSQFVSGKVRGNKIGTRENLASASLYSGYDVFKWKSCGNLTHFQRAPYRLRPHDVEMCIHISSRLPHAAERSPEPSGATLMPMAVRKRPKACSYLRRADRIRTARSLP